MANPAIILSTATTARQDYQLQLKNRETISYHSSWIEYGPIIIPVKYRFQRTMDGKVAKDQFQTDLNIGIYGGYNT